MGCIYKLSPLLSHLPLDMYNRSCVSVPCDNHIIDREKGNDGAID